jgi:hypothetical protein
MADEKLVQYVYQILKRGDKEEDIKDKLLKAGHDIYSITPAFSAAKDKLRKEESLANRNRLIIRNSLIVIMILIAVAAIYFLAQPTDPKHTSSFGNLKSGSGQAASSTTYCAPASNYVHRELNISAIVDGIKKVAGRDLCKVTARDRSASYYYDTEGNVYALNSPAGTIAKSEDLKKIFPVINPVPD